MSENRFLVAGWAAIAAAGLMPAAFIVAGLEQAAFDLDLTKRTVGLFASDFLLLIFGAAAIYVLIGLKRMVMGLCGLTVILSFFSLLLFPVAYIALGIAFLRPEKRLEFI